jgi:hypothetical protein
MRLLAGLIAVLSLHACGWFDRADDCALNPILECGPWGGTDGGPPLGCDPSMTKSAVADACGVFVSSEHGDDTNGTGTQAAPYKTITAALAKGTTVYVCAGTTAYSEAVTLDKAVTLFGALDCGTWVYDAENKTQLTAPADMVPLTLSGAANGTEVEDFTITAADAMMAGGSSIAVIANGVAASFTRTDITAGKGADGAPGTTPAGSGQPGTAAPMPSPATALDGCGSQTGVFGGDPGQTKCGTTDTSGGKGGDGTNLAVGGTATDAQPQPQPNASPGFDGKAGKPQDTMACLPGDSGAGGLPGTMPGTGATGLGNITSNGYQPPAAAAGQSAGSPGYGGGGGGGGAKCANGFAGPAGGGGGAGGCGGQPGEPGGSAGSSFAFVSLGATISLSSVTLTSVNGGAGGAGGNGQPGGQGGNGGNAGSSNGDGSVSACNGGKGGQGGRGSSGGGGLGGHSAGIAFTGTAPMQTMVTIQHGKGGSGGIGGDMDMTSPGIVGGSGLGCTTLNFSIPASPTPCAM